MKPIAVIQHSALVGPGHFASFLDVRKLPWRHIRIDQGDTVPEDPTVFSGICLMGGEMSVNDDLPWIHAELELIRKAVKQGVPVIGHCLGGQLLSKALGGSVSRNPVREIGWGTVTCTDTPASRAWLGDLGSFESFHWHGETFSLPEGAEVLFGSSFCSNQAFVIGPHLGMQCHVEMTESLIHSWADVWANELSDPDKPKPSIQDRTSMLAQTDEKLPHMRKVAERLYTHWLGQVQSF